MELNIDKLEPPKLKKWLELEDIKNKLAEAVEHKNYDEVADLLCSYVSTAIDLDVRETAWCDVISAYEKTAILCIPKDIPILRYGKSDTKIPWDYEGREWIFWLHKLSSVYGWKPEYVEFMDFNVAIGLMQEIFIDDFTEKEWEWDLSEITYSYDSASGKSKHIPFAKPEWMKDISKFDGVDKPVRMLKSMLPAGVVVSLKDNYAVSKSDDETI